MQPALIDVAEVQPGELPDPLAAAVDEIDMTDLSTRRTRRVKKIAGGCFAVLAPVAAPGHPGKFGHVKVGHVREERVWPARFVAFLNSGSELGRWADKGDAIMAVWLFARRLR